MDKKEYLHLLERESSPWYLAKNELILSFLQRIFHSGGKILDVGCGMGGTMVYFQHSKFKIKGIDKYLGAVNFCHKRKLTVKLGLAEKIPFPENYFDVVIALELLEHLKRPERATKEFSRVLKPNGLLVISVPAFNFFWSNLDEVSRHFKRYTIPMLKREVEPEFKIIKISYIFFSAFLPMLFLRLVRRTLREKDNHLLRDEFPNKPGILEFFILSSFRLENIILRWFNFPFGVGIIGIFSNRKVPKDYT